MLVPDQRPVQQFAPAGPDPPLHDRIHPRYPDAALNDADASIDQHGVEGRGELGVPVPYQEPGGAAGVLQIHDKVATSLGHPLSGEMCGDAEDPHAAGGVLDDCQIVQARSSQGADLEEITSQQGASLAA
ncbi:hypothetical protein [Nonomuraea sp. CA-141351]|uniref:hypothetical protein n=1 Tax=Nonomuraea sp. CA-141351 TaxID=3239996 RepID=UPI003D8FC7DE